MLANKKLKKIFIKYFYRILSFLIFYLCLINPLQIKIIDKIIKPLIEEKIVETKYYKLVENKYHLTITHKYEKNVFLHFSIPFGQAYFFLIFFLKFKPKNLVFALSIYNLVLVPLYTLAIIFFLNGYFILGFLVTVNQQFNKFMYGSVFLLRVINRKKFYLIFRNLKK
tara:strand:- start:2300 stop:2803 length:504 start_codon:yes stop_codon:yes gene_type:complete